MNFNDLTRAIKYDMCNLKSFTTSTNCLYLTYQGKYEKHIDKNKEIAEYHMVIRLVDNDKDQIYSS